MAITRRLPRSKLLFLFACLCLALDLSRAARVPSDQFVFPSDSKPNNPPIRLESRLREIERQMEEVTRATNVTLLMPKESKRSEPRTTANENTTQKPGNTPHKTRNISDFPNNSTKGEIDLPSRQGNKTQPSSESKMVTFVKEPESDKPAPWDQATPATIVSDPKGVIIGPRIVLETTKICPEGTTLTVNDHCRKIA
ncbi:hypothetical protein KR084_003419 [Drosophila pseudotakahashii]|nr:hypothetical protein KR084_003419 [Drosophila pseudotakahashii]